MTATIEAATATQAPATQAPERNVEPPPPAAPAAATPANAPDTIGVARPARPTRVLPEGVAIIGHEASWNVSGVMIQRDELARRLTAAGFPEAIPQRAPTAKRNLRLAITKWAEQKTGLIFERADADPAERGAVRRRKKLIRQIEGAEREEGEGARPTVLALVEEKSLGARLELTYYTGYRFRLSPPSGEETEHRLAVSTASRGSMTDYEEREEERARVDAEIRPLWDLFKNLYTGGDLSLMLREIVHGLNGISVEAGSGVYFVPAQAGDAVDRLEAFVQGLAEFKPSGFPPHFRAREAVDTERTRAAMAAAALDALTSEVRQAEDDLEQTEQRNAEKPGSVKVQTVRGLVAEMMRIKAKAAFYADISGLRAERIEEELQPLAVRARTIVKANLAGREERLGNPAAARRVVGAGEGREERA